MRTSILVPLLAVLAALVAASAAQAGQLVSAQLTLHFNAGFFPPVQFSSSGALAGWANGSGATASWSVGAGVVPTGTATLTLETSVAPPISQLQFVLNGNAGAGTFAASSPGSMLVVGQVNVRAYGGATLLGVPIGFGAPTVIMPPLVSGIGVTSYGNAWTTKTAVVTLTTDLGTGAISMMGANGLVDGGGTVVLVTALNVLPSIATQLPSFAVLTLTYAAAPEASLLLLLASGGGLVWLGRRALRKEPPARDRSLSARRGHG
jgi:hypothetical protein